MRQALDSQAIKKWGPTLLPTPNAPSEGSAKPQVQVPGEPQPEFRLTSSGVAFHPTASSRGETRQPYRSAWPEGSLPFRPVRPVIGPKSSAGAIRCSAALLGITFSCVPLCSPAIRRPPGAASRSRKIISSGASSRLATKSPEGNFPLPAAEIGSLNHLPHLPAVAGFPTRPGPRSRSQTDTDSAFRVAPSEKCGGKPVDIVDIGNNRGNLFES
jgi:hypothetical protein